MSYRSSLCLRMRGVIVGVAVYVLFPAPSLFAQREQVLSGRIDQCACVEKKERSAIPDKTEAAASCPFTCASAGARYVFADTKNKIAYQFDKQNFPAAFATQQVFVIGTLDEGTGTLHVNNIIPDLPPEIKKAKTVSIVCDACPRGMAKARKAAFEQLSVWKRFAVVPDPKKADLILLFSANRYLGDYLTRDGPDKRLVSVETTYMNVVDPHTGKSLWGDSERLGSWFVGSATKDMIDELREMLEADVNPVQRELFLKRFRIPKPIANEGK